MRNIYQIAGIAVTALALAYGCQDEVEEKSLPADAGAISGAAANICPDTAVALTVEAVSGAAEYVWYKDGEVIPNALSATYAAVASGSYAVAGKNDDGEGKKSAAHAVTISACPDENVDAPPAAAGAIAGATENGCPVQTVTLSVNPIQGAASYLWLAAYGEGDVDSTSTPDTSYTVDFSTLAEGQQVSFTVSGVNSLGVGAASQPHVVTKQLCLAARPVIVGNGEWLTERRGDTAVYTTVCPATKMQSRATVTSGEVIRYSWYRQQVGVDAELEPWVTDGSAGIELGVKGYTYNYAVVAVTVDGGSEMSNIAQVIGPACPLPGVPGGTTPFALYPTGAYPQSPPYSFEISNCDIQERTFQVETSVELACNATSAADNPDYQPTGYAFWVKTPDVDTFRLVATTGVNPSERRITIDGDAYLSGTYRVTAFNSNGHSEFGNNEITVTIRTDCPAPPTPQLDAPTIITTLTGGVLANACPSPNASANLFLNIPSTPPGEVTSYKWSRIGSNGGAPEVVWEGADRQEINKDSISIANNGTYRVTYTKTIGGTPYESDPAEVTIALTECLTSGYTRADLIGEYDVVDYRSGRTGFSQFTYETLTIAAGANDNEIIISNLGNINASLTATVTFTSDGETTGNYGTILIPKQETSSGYKFSLLTVTGAATACRDGSLELAIQLVEGKLTMSQTGTRYGVWNTGADCAPVTSVRGGDTETMTWTKY